MLADLAEAELTAAQDRLRVDSEDTELFEAKDSLMELTEDFLSNAAAAEISTVEKQQHALDTLATAPAHNIEDASSIDAHITADEVVGQFTRRYGEDFRQLLERQPGLFSVENVARAKESASDLFGVRSQAICRRLCLMGRF